MIHPIVWAQWLVNIITIFPSLSVLHIAIIPGVDFYCHRRLNLMVFRIIPGTVGTGDGIGTNATGMHGISQSPSIISCRC